MTALATGRPLIEGVGEGPLLRLAAPISFWGGVDPQTARITDPRHPDYDVCLSDAVVWIPSTIGSSSSSSVLLELIRLGIAPAALLLGRADPILSLGAVVAREMEYGTLPVVELPAEDDGRSPLDPLASGTRLRVASDGQITAA